MTTLATALGQRHAVALGSAGCTAPGRPPAALGETMARLITCIGGEDFHLRMLEECGSLFDAGAWSAYVLARDDAPELVASATLEPPHKSGECFGVYRDGLYKQDSSFDEAWRAGSTMLTCWRARDFNRRHRTQIYERIEATERMSLVAPLDDGLLAVNIYRTWNQRPFSAVDATTAAQVAPAMFACVRKHMEVSALHASLLRGASIAAVQPLPADEAASATHAAHAAHGTRSGVSGRSALVAHCPNLTDREADVIGLLLDGLTYEGAAAQLGVSPATIKTYRERAFRKLGINFRNELYALAMRLRNREGSAGLTATAAASPAALS